MNPTLVVLSLAATLLCRVTFADDPPTTSERLKDAAREAGDAFRRAAGAVAQEARGAWNQAQAYFSDDPATYRQGAATTLQELGAELAQLRQQSAAVAPERVYFQTLLAALEQQRQFAGQQLAALSPEAIRAGREGTRRGVDATLQHLEEHLDIAREELRSFIGAK